MGDRFAGTSAALLMGPATHAFAITPHASNALSETTRAIYVGTAGNIAVTMASGTDVTFVGVAAGTVLPIRVTHVKVSGTTASDIVGLT